MKGVWDGVGRGRGALPLACLSPPAHPNLVLPFLDIFILIYTRLMPTLSGKHDDRAAKRKISEHVARRESRRSEAVVVVSGKPWHPMLLSLTEVPAARLFPRAVQHVTWLNYLPNRLVLTSTCSCPPVVTPQPRQTGRCCHLAGKDEKEGGGRGQVVAGSSRESPTRNTGPARLVSGANSPVGQPYTRLTTPPTDTQRYTATPRNIRSATPSLSPS